MWLVLVVWVMAVLETGEGEVVFLTAIRCSG
jgi:hypothetical protein